MHYTGVGARNTPSWIENILIFLGASLSEKGYILRSGGADGADISFEIGCNSKQGKKEIYLPWKNFNDSDSDLYLENFKNSLDAEKIAEEIHPVWGKLKQGAKKLHTRNVFQVLGKDLKTPSKFLLCYTDGGEIKGGTATAINLALKNNIKVLNLWHVETSIKCLQRFGGYQPCYEGLIEILPSNCVFVFGSNLDGFHGAGSAGYASFNESGNVWRKYNYGEKTNGWKGKWNVKGQGEGLQKGTEGFGYALPTVTKAGAKKSLSLEKIKENVKKMYSCAENNPDKWFIVGYNDESKPLNGYTAEEFSSCFLGEIPPNVVFNKQFKKLTLENDKQ